MIKENKNPCHKSEITRLNRITGQVNGIVKMIEEGRYCPEILQQLNAVKFAINAVQANILENHLSNCVKDAMVLNDANETRKKIDELKEIFKKYCRS